ncbi:uncharacterized protein LOC120107807 [Phoenix dactylifera]|uniref:Uncharacterized protein LOC103697828 n=1 Tax=Phoenix dactylifera TaxID=42345 RepID=A0A8B8ZSG0_PHODC|nr:uncharacterized protein LOC103697828 [Phoenix dactylifera]XP_038977186.1 uncharacterized protein LOC120107807 [Phoenix dactylifera]
MASKTRKKSLISSHLLLLPPTMKDFASCFSEHAVKVSDASCSGGSGHSSPPENRSVQSAVTCLYRSRLSTRKEFLIRVTWSRSHVGPALSIGVDDSPSLRDWKPTSMNSRLLRKKKGSESYALGSSVVDLRWDISSAKYGPGPEPTDDFYVAIIVDAQFGLLLGDMSRDYIERFEEKIPVAEFSMFSRREQVLGHSLHSTKARFREDGRDHEITIRCKEDGWDAKESELSVCVDKKRVVYVRRLRWNFRGNQTIFIDGTPVDMMWDLHDWWFSSPSGGYAVFMFRTRSALESRLWLEEEILHKEQAMSGFSLLIQSFKS